MKNITPVFRWAKVHGESVVVDRILVKIVPQLLKANLAVSQEKISRDEVIEVDEDMYILILQTAQKVVGLEYTGEENV